MASEIHPIDRLHTWDRDKKRQVCKILVEGKKGKEVAEKYDALWDESEYERDEDATILVLLALWGPRKGDG